MLYLACRQDAAPQTSACAAAGGPGPRLESWAFAVDEIGLQVALDAGVFHVRNCKLCTDGQGIVVGGEYGITRGMFKAGYNVATLMSKYAVDTDWRNPQNWHCNNNVHPSRWVASRTGQGAVYDAACACDACSSCMAGVQHCCCMLLGAIIKQCCASACAAAHMADLAHTAASASEPVCTLLCHTGTAPMTASASTPMRLCL
jgi:hypothetical protein